MTITVHKKYVVAYNIILILIVVYNIKIDSFDINLIKIIVHKNSYSLYFDIIKILLRN